MSELSPFKDLVNISELPPFTNFVENQRFGKYQ